MIASLALLQPLPTDTAIAAPTKNVRKSQSRKTGNKKMMFQQRLPLPQMMVHLAATIQ
jgi:hypothetical protein